MVFIRNVTFMTDDPRRLADFWSAVLALTERRDEAEATICADAEWRYPRLTFQKVSESDERPRRLHLDLTSDDRVPRSNAWCRSERTRSARLPRMTAGPGR
jgi:hypothetical protein